MTSIASTSVAAADTRIGTAVQKRAAAALGGEQLLARRIVDGRHLARRRRSSSASEAQKIGRPCAKFVVPSIGSNTQHGPRGTVGAAAQLFGQHRVIGKPLARSSSRNIALDREIDLGDQIDRALLVDAEIAARTRAIMRSPARTTASIAVVR